MSGQTARKVCRRLRGGVAPGGMCAEGKGVQQLSTHHSQGSRPAAAGGPGKHGGAAGWPRTRGPPTPMNRPFLCHNLPGFSHLCLILGLIYLGFLFIQKHNTSTPGPGVRQLPRRPRGPHPRLFPREGWSSALGLVAALPRRAGKSRRLAGPAPSSGLRQAALGGPEGFIWIFLIIVFYFSSPHEKVLIYTVN